MCQDIKSWILLLDLTTANTDCDMITGYLQGFPFKKGVYSLADDII